MESSEKIMLPRDAEGKEIPLDTKVLYNKKGEKLCIKRIEFDPFSKEWGFRLPGDLYCWNITCRPKDVYLVNPAQPDSWKKLLDDLKYAAEAANRSLGASCCTWFNGDKGCVGCPADEANDETCGSQFVNDIAARIRKLSGED